MCTTPVFLGDVHGLSAQWVPEVLEMMFFATAVSCETGEPEEPVFEVQVRFKGAVSGIFSLWISAGVASVLAAGFLGLDASEIGPMESAQVACELANMLCGSVLSRAESETGFELTAPILVAPEPRGPAETDDRVRFALDLNGVIEIAFRVEEQVTL
jgi:hypothetical protein